VVAVARPGRQWKAARGQPGSGRCARETAQGKRPGTDKPTELARQGRNEEKGGRQNQKAKSQKKRIAGMYGVGGRRKGKGVVVRP